MCPPYSHSRQTPTYFKYFIPCRFVFPPKGRVDFVVEVLAHNEGERGGHHGVYSIDEFLHSLGHTRFEAAHARIEHDASDTCKGL